MKHVNFAIVLAAAAAVALTSCKKEEGPGVDSGIPTVNFIADNHLTTKTEISEGNTVSWSANGEYIGIYRTGDVSGLAYKKSNEGVAQSDGKMAFSAQFDETEDTKYTFVTVYPASSVDGQSAATVNAKIPALQTPTLTSFDPSTDILVSSPVTAEASDKDLNLQYSRVVSVAKMTVRGLATTSAISKIVFTAEEGTGLVGLLPINTTTAEVGSVASATNTVTINTPEDFTNRCVAYFAVAPCTIASGKTFTVSVTVGSDVYSKTFTATEDMAFRAGHAVELTVDMGGATVNGEAASTIFTTTYEKGKYGGLEKDTIVLDEITDINGTDKCLAFPDIKYFNGKFYAMYTAGPTITNSANQFGQRIEILSSTDAKVWDIVKTISTTVEEKIEVASTGLFVSADGSKLTAFYTRRVDGQGRKEYATSTTDGTTWSDPAATNLAAGYYPNFAPYIMKSGRLLFTDKDHYYTDDETGMTGWTKCTYKQPSSNWGSAIEIRDKVYILLRSGSNNLQQMSSSDGITFSDAVVTNFTNANNPVCFGRLEDGRYYYVGTPDNTNAERGGLVLSLSDDGFLYNRHYGISFDREGPLSGTYANNQHRSFKAMVHGDNLYVITCRRFVKIELYIIPLTQKNLQ